MTNGSQTSYESNRLNQYSKVAGVNYIYDVNGNLISKTGGGSTTSYGWNWRNLLLSVSGAGNNTLYEYDGDGTRISKTQSGVKTKYINDVAFSLVQVLMETDNAGAFQAIYNYGNDLISMNRAGVNSYYNYDGLGSTRQLTNSTGAVAASYVYDSFGNVISQTTGGMASNPARENESINKAGISLFAFLGLGIGIVTIRNRRNGLIVLLIILLIADPVPNSMAIEFDVTGNPYGFTGESQFGEADDLVFLRARYYKPSIGRFISRDPIGYAETPNLYLYGRNNPLSYIDPTGMDSWDVRACKALCLVAMAGCIVGCSLICGPGALVCLWICRSVCMVGGYACFEACEDASRCPPPAEDWPRWPRWPGHGLI